MSRGAARAKDKEQKEQWKESCEGTEEQEAEGAGQGQGQEELETEGTESRRWSN